MTERRLPRVRSARARILASMILLLAFSTVISTIALREILLSRVDTRSEKGIVQEVTEFRGFSADARDPRTGERLGDRLDRIFDAFLARDIPDEGEATFTFLDGRPYRSNADSTTSRELLDAVRSLGDVQTVRRGDVSSPEGRVRYIAVPVRADGRVRGAFVVTSAVGQEAAEVTEAVQVAAGVALAVLLLASVLGWVIAGRVLAPLRELDSAARAIGSSDLTQRIHVEGHDEIAELGRTFNAMLDRLEAAFSSQREFVSDAGHELRTPITIIRGHLELLGDDPEERRETIALVTDELDRMGRFVDDLLTLAKAERPDFLRLQDVDVDELTDELMAKASALAPRRWEREAIALGQVRADRQRLTQAVMSLAQNAVEHTREGDRIALGSALEPGELRLWVADDGPGIPAAEQERVFERFARGESAGRRSEGAGLGLAIVRAIADAHGGRVELRSEPGKGSRFTLVLPVAAVPAPEPVGVA